MWEFRLKLIVMHRAYFGRVMRLGLLLVAFARGARVGPCECHDDWAACSTEPPRDSGLGEDELGCAGTGKSCAEICPGDLPWKALYRRTVRTEREREEACKGDPTAAMPDVRWRNASITPTFAIAFSGGLRGFVSTWHSWKHLVVAASGGKAYVHTFFHVWDRSTMSDERTNRLSRKLAREVAFKYVEEPFADFASLLSRDEPRWIDDAGNKRSDEGVPESWLSFVMPTFGAEHRIFHLNFLSQWRKVHLALQLVRAAEASRGAPYDLVVRARPDSFVVAPLDLRAVLFSFGARPSVLCARGHFLAVPERLTGERYNDHLAVGTLDALERYGERPLPYSMAKAEQYMNRNLAQQCFFRDAKVLAEEFNLTAGPSVPLLSGERTIDPSRLRELEAARFAGPSLTAPAADSATASYHLTRLGIGAVPAGFRASEMSPLLVTYSTTEEHGPEACRGRSWGGAVVGPTGDATDATEAVGGCIPSFRLRHTFLHRVSPRAWFGCGSVCFAHNGHEPASVADLLADIGVALRDEATDATEGQQAIDTSNTRDPIYPICVRVAALAAAHRDAVKYLTTRLRPIDREFLLTHRR